MVITTERLILRPFKIEDVKDYYNIVQDSAIRKYVPYVYEESPADLEKAIRNTFITCDFEHDFYFVIQQKDTNTIVGCLIAIQDIDFMFDMNLVIAQPYRQHGYMTEALTAFIKELPKNQTLLFYVKKDNYPSVRTINKIGALESNCTIQHYRKFLLTTR